MRTSSILLSIAALSFAVTGCSQYNHKEAGGDMQGETHRDHGAMAAGVDKHHAAEVEIKHENMWSSIKNAVVVVYPTKGNSVSGTVYFDQADYSTDGKPRVHVHGSITGLEPNSTHACHIHEFGDQSSADGAAAGSHYDPDATHHHANPTASEPHHPGDLGNLTADASGKTTLDLTVTGLTIAGMKDPIIGRALVIHAKPDDFSQPVGNAGGRIAVGVIGVAKPQP